MKNKKKHLQKEERFFIEKTLKTGKSIGFIARLLERGVSTISAEISKNGGREAYNSNLAQNKALQSQSRKKFGLYKLLLNKKLRKHVESRLNEGLSPEAISKNLKWKTKEVRSKSFYASPKSIRKFITYKLNLNKPY